MESSRPWFTSLSFDRNTCGSRKGFFFFLYEMPQYALVFSFFVLYAAKEILPPFPPFFHLVHDSLPIADLQLTITSADFFFFFLFSLKITIKGGPPHLFLSLVDWEQFANGPFFFYGH